MDISYNKLFKIMIDRKMKKKDLQEATGLSPASIAKLSKDQYVSMEVLVKICRALQVDVGDILEIVHKENNTISSSLIKVQEAPISFQKD